jgi:hypothetical protein
MSTVNQVPKLDLYAVWVMEVERLADAINLPYRRTSNASAVQMVRPSDQSSVRGHAESEMIQARAGRIERLARVVGVLVYVDA